MQSPTKLVDFWSYDRKEKFHRFFDWVRFETLLRTPNNLWGFSKWFFAVMEPYKFPGVPSKASNLVQSRNGSNSKPKCTKNLFSKQNIKQSFKWSKTVNIYFLIRQMISNVKINQYKIERKQENKNKIGIPSSWKNVNFVPNPRVVF